MVDNININELIDFKYAIGIILGAYLIITYLINNTKFIKSDTEDTHKHISIFLWGVALGIIWYLTLNSKLDTLIITYFVSVLSYDKVLNPILKKLGIKKKRIIKQ